MAPSPKYSDPEVLAHISGLAFRAQQVVEGTLSGMHRSPYRGANVEFAEYREYSPGDDLRRLDWRVYGRTDRYFIKQFEEESNLRCTFVVDCSASMDYRSQPLSKFDYAATIAASLAMLLVRQQDAVGLVLSDANARHSLHPVATQGQLQRMLEIMEDTQPGGTTELGATLAQLGEQLPTRGMVVVLSDLFTNEDRWVDGLAQLRFRGHDVLVLHILDPDEIEFPFQDPIVFEDMENHAEPIYAEPWQFQQAYRRAVEEFTERLQRHCHQHRAEYQRLSTREPLAPTLSHFLHHRVRHGGRL